MLSKFSLSMFRSEEPGLAKNLGVRPLGDNRAWYRSGAAARPFNAVRKRIPTLFARATMFIMQTAERFLATLRAHEVELRQAGLRFLSLFGSLTRGERKTGSNIDLAAEGYHNEITGIVQLDFR
jgi:hypothetical protein